MQNKKHEYTFRGAWLNHNRFTRVGVYNYLFKQGQNFFLTYNNYKWMNINRIYSLIICYKSLDNGGGGGSSSSEMYVSYCLCVMCSKFNHCCVSKQAVEFFILCKLRKIPNTINSNIYTQSGTVNGPDSYQKLTSPRLLDKMVLTSVVLYTY